MPTKMGGSSAPDSLEEGFATQVWLAVSNEPEALTTGGYFHHKKKTRSHPSADSTDTQELFLAKCEELTGIQLT
ncbi:MAG: hypothetical protein QM802_05085 [Agriterribacter sp.]